MSYPPGNDEPAWLTIARRELGVRELPGARHEARILQYHAATRLQAKADEVPWCAAFVCWCLEQAGVTSTRSAAARSYATYGQPAHLVNGAIVVFPPHDPDAGGSGHVGFYCDGRLLGGNQRNRVGLDPRDFSAAVAVRWPLF